MGIDFERWQGVLTNSISFQVVIIERYDGVWAAHKLTWPFTEFKWDGDKQITGHRTLGILKDKDEFVKDIEKLEFFLNDFHRLPIDLKQYIWSCCVPLEWKSQMEELGYRVHLYYKVD